MDTPLSNLILLGWSLLQVVAGWLLLLLLFRRLGADSAALRWGLAILCLVPVFVRQETVDFRYWEGALALTLVTTNLILIMDMEGRTSPSVGRLALIAWLTALTLFLCAPAGLAVDLCWAVWALRTLDWRRLFLFAGLGAGAAALIVLPWALRNAAMLGEPVLLRSNAGLELAMGNHAAALSARPPEQVLVERHLAIHPYQSPAARVELARAGGEVAYARRLGEETRAWIRSDPLGFARLSVRHYRQFFFPDAWQMDFTGWEGMQATRALAMGLVSLIGIAGLIAGLVRRRRGYWTLALYLVTVALPYAFVQPYQRYSYLAHGLLAMLAADALVRAARTLNRRVRDGQDGRAAALPAVLRPPCPGAARKTG